uniref:Uncharacterized protein n=1 Tax=Kalanchoe fedtschenkoi TaxID=63787 RepID=A0A7N0TJQ7_KALFE
MEKTTERRWIGRVSEGEGKRPVGKGNRWRVLALGGPARVTTQTRRRPDMDAAEEVENRSGGGGEELGKEVAVEVGRERRRCDDGMVGEKVKRAAMFVSGETPAFIASPF